MASITEAIGSEIVENWPAFAYILVSAVFSICFFRERRAEVRDATLAATALQNIIGDRLDRLELLIRSTHDPGFGKNNRV